MNEIEVNVKEFQELMVPMDFYLDFKRNIKTRIVEFNLNNRGQASYKFIPLINNVPCSDDKQLNESAEIFIQNYLLFSIFNQKYVC